MEQNKFEDEAAKAFVKRTHIVLTILKGLILITLGFVGLYRSLH